MNAADHHAAALVALEAATRLADKPIAAPLAELAGWHEAEAERLALDAVEVRPAAPAIAAGNFPGCPGY